MLLGCAVRLRSRVRPLEARQQQAAGLLLGGGAWGRRRLALEEPSARLLSGGMSAGAVPSPAAAVVHRLSEYRPPVFRATDVELDVALDDVTKVVSRVKYVRAEGSECADLELHCERKPANMTLQRVALDGRELAQGSYSVGPSSVRIPAQLLSASFTLECSVTVEPAANTSLSGLYKSGAMLTTQMEAEGFRNFCPFVDRPDHLATYTTRLEADKERFPVLLSNGEDIERGDLAGGKKHYVVWRDMFPKPSYLFAIVAGDLAVRRDSFVTRPSGKVVQLAIWVDKEDAGKTEWAMRCIKSAMAWDEMRFGREYDVCQFNIVGTKDFTMGAMENATLNIFNSRCLLAERHTQTDADYQRIQAIIGHEFFHHWTGNRVTVASWFDLTLKEGLTVLRDQLFTSDLNSAVAKRIEDVKFLREVQFVEDASPISHPIRPETYEEISNFYTSTVYEKGAEVIRMMATIVGSEGFKRGLTLYFDRHVGQAVTCEDFVRAIADANPSHDLSQFQRTWYRQRGTPRLDVSYAYDAARHELALTVRQRCDWMPAGWEPFDIPLAVGLIGRASRKPLLVSAAPGAPSVATVVLRVTRAEQRFVLHGVRERPVPSLLRDFSAPVRMHCADLSLEDLSFLAACDTDEFVRYDSLQALALRALCADGGGGLAVSGAQAGSTSGGGAQELLLQSLRETLDSSERLDKTVVAMSLELPDEHALVDASGDGEADVDAIKAACARLTSQVASELGPLLLQVYEANCAPREGESDGAAAARRALKNACLRAMVDWSAPSRCASARQLALRQVLAADNMTDRMGGALALRDCACPERELALQHFYETHRHDALVLNKWFSLQAMSSVPTSRIEVEAVLAKGAEVKFERTNPNNCYALIKSFAGNFSALHAPGGPRFVADQIIALDKINAQVASRIAKEITGWRKFKAPWGGAIKAQLERIAAQPDLSPDVAEIVSKALAPPLSTL